MNILKLAYETEKKLISEIKDIKIISMNKNKYNDLVIKLEDGREVLIGNNCHGGVQVYEVCTEGEE